MNECSLMNQFPVLSVYPKIHFSFKPHTQFYLQAENLLSVFFLITNPRNKIETKRIMF